MSDWSLRQKLRESIIDAVNRGDHVQVDELISKGADVNESEGGYLSKRTLLIMAVEKGHVDAASVLVNRGADLSASVMVNKREVTALDIARDKELESLVTVIEKKMEANERLLSAVQDGNSDQVQETIRSGANINMLHKDGDSPQMNMLFLALSEGHMDVARTLIQAGIDLHFTVAFPDQTKEDTARSFAERMNQDDLVSLIDEAIAGQGTSLALNTPHENSHAQQKPAKKSDSKSKGDELEDIEDADLEENPESNTAGPGRQRRAAAGRTCVVF